MSVCEVCTGLFVREDIEKNVYVVWTERFNHVHISKDNGNIPAEPCDPVEVNVFTEERINGQYRYEGFDIRFPDDLPNGCARFSPCSNSRNQMTIKWQGQLQLTNERKNGYYLVKSVADNVAPQFVIRASITNGARHEFIGKNIVTFEGICVLRQFTEANVCPWEFHEFYYPGELEKTNNVAATGPSVYQKCLGVFVREETHIYIIWTKTYNHVYVKKENFNQQIQLFDRVEIDVLTDERIYGQYRFEGINCRLTYNMYTPHHANTFFDGEFSRYSNFGEMTIQWHGVFELTEETTEDGGGFAQSIQFDVNGGISAPRFIERAFIGKSDRDWCLLHEVRQFESSVMLCHFAEPNACAWKIIPFHMLLQPRQAPSTPNTFVESAYQTPTIKFLETKVRKQLNGSLVVAKSLQPGSSIFVPSPKLAESTKAENMIKLTLSGCCLFSDESYSYFYCCVDDGTADSKSFFGYLLKISNSFGMQFGNWYRLAMNTNDVMINPNLLPNDSILAVDCVRPHTDKIYFLNCSTNNETFQLCTSVIVKAYAHSLPTFGFFSKFIDKLIDPNGIVLEAGNNCHDFAESHYTTCLCFILEVCVSLEHGFVVNRCFGLDTGKNLESYIQLAEGTDVKLSDDSQQWTANGSSEYVLHSLQQQMLISDDVNRGGECESLHELLEQSDVSLPTMEIPLEESESDLGFGSGALKELLNILFSEKLKGVTEAIEGIKCTIDGIKCSIDVLVGSMENVHMNSFPCSQQTLCSGDILVRKADDDCDKSNVLLKVSDNPCHEFQHVNAKSTGDCETAPIVIKNGLKMDSLKNVLRALYSPVVQNIIKEEGLLSELLMFTE